MEYAVLHSLQSNNSVIQFWFGTVPRKLDANIVLPALTGIIVSGVGQATLDNGGLASVPSMWWVPFIYCRCLDFGVDGNGCDLTKESCGGC